MKKYKPSIRGKVKILQYDIDNNFIKEWDSATDITNELGYKNACISNCCRNRSKTSYGYKWVYKTKI